MPTDDMHANYSFISLFLQADIVVQIIMAGLIAVSIWCWAIMAHKFILLKKLKKHANHFEDEFWSGQPLDILYKQVDQKEEHPMSLIFKTGMREWIRVVKKSKLFDTIQMRIERMMGLTLRYEMENLQKYLGFLASVGSTATFVGLFGTVWGIMSSFQSIATAKNTHLAIVAPGIAEALLATAFGLIAAIPAVIGYNKLSHEFALYASRLESFISEFSTILVRRLEDREDGHE